MRTFTCVLLGQGNLGQSPKPLGSHGISLGGSGSEATGAVGPDLQTAQRATSGEQTSHETDSTHVSGTTLNGLDGRDGPMFSCFAGVDLDRTEGADGEAVHSIELITGVRIKSGQERPVHEVILETRHVDLIQYHPPNWRSAN